MPLSLMRRLVLWRLLVPAAAAGCAMSAALAAEQGIYSCVDASGKRLTSDRPIAECLDREQRVLNKDGSQRRVLPPRMNAEERAAEKSVSVSVISRRPRARMRFGATAI